METEKEFNQTQEKESQNLLQLRDLLEQEFGERWTNLFLRDGLRQLVGFSIDDSSLPLDQRQKAENSAFENIEITPEIVDQVNIMICHQAELKRHEFNLAIERSYTHQAIMEIQGIAEIFQGKKLVIKSECGDIVIEKEEKKQERDDNFELYGLARTLGLSEGKKFKGKLSEFDFVRLRKIIETSYTRDVSHDCGRWFSNEIAFNFNYPKADKFEARRRMDVILKRGYKSEAKQWIEAASPEGMKFGTATKEGRIKEAKRWAEKAGISLEEIVQEMGVDLKNI